MKKLFSLAWALAVLSVFLALPVSAQNRTAFGGRFNAIDYAYGIAPVGVAQPAPALQVYTGAPSGTQTITLVSGFTTLGDGRIIFPLSTVAPILVGGGSNQETVTPTAVSSACSIAQPYAGCTITAVFANAHGTGDPIMTGSFGIQEAANAAAAVGGGIVVVNSAWAAAGGTTAKITGAVLSGTSFTPTVTIEDARSLPITYWAPRPTTLSLIAAPNAPTNASVSGSLTSGAYYTAQECVDPLGGITLPSTDSTQTGTVTGITFTPSACGTGSVGYIPLVTAAGGSTGTEIEVPVTSSVCTTATQYVTTGKPVCALGAVATITANPSSTAKLVVEGTAHTTFAPQPFSSIPPPFQTQYGPFVATATLNSSNADGAQFYTPAGYFNYLGKSWNVCVKGATATAVASSVLVVKLQVAKQYAQSPVTLSTITFPTQTRAAAGTFGGCWKVTTAATGASGTFWSVSPQPWYAALNTAPGTAVTSIDVTTAASSAVDLTAGLYWSVNLSETAGANLTGPIINSLTIEPANAN